MNSARFGRCELRPEERELRVDGKLATLGGRTFDLLLLLVGSAGELVTKEQILGQVWRGTVVEENTLQVHISALRKILGVDRSFIKTISGHGYRFVARVSQGDSARSSAKTVARLLTNIPAPTAELFGRAPELAAVLGLVGEHRMVTLVGAGGMGKTRIGLEAARRLRDRFPDGVWLAQLGALRDPELVASTVAATLQIESTGSNDFAKRIAVELASKTTLLVLDDCEHVIEAAARIAEAVLAASPTVRIIATSRESLRADGERVFRVRGLDVPRPDCDNTAEILGAGAVQLFMARALAAEPRLELDTRTSNAAAVICRRLDGIPLAIELAAARVATLGVEELAARLNDRFSLPSGGRRSALPRHQTLRALIDWSYDLLTEAERVTLRRLAVFAGSVTLAAASTVIPGPNSPTLDVLEGIASLVEKSLVVADVSAGATPCYRMLETTRQYAREKLSESGEFETLARRHALHFLGLLAQAEAEGDTRPAAEWLTRYGPSIDDVRAALTWSFSPTGDTSLGVALTVVATPLLIQCSLIDECRERVDRALSAAVPASSRDLSTEMRLLAARSQSLVHTVGLIPETRASWIRTYELAASLDNAEHQLRALWEQVSVCINTGELAGALELGRKLADLAGQRGDAGDVLAAGRVNGYVLHLLGQHAQARCHLEGGLERAHRLAPQSHFDRYGIDQGIAAQCTLARILWLQGFPDRAKVATEAAVQKAQAVGHGASLRYAASQAAGTATILSGDLDDAERYIALLSQNSPRPVFRFWDALSRGLDGQLRIGRGAVAQGLPLLQDAFSDLQERGFEGTSRPLYGALSLGLAAVDRVPEALGTIDTAIEYAERSGERWLLPEWLRIKAELLLADQPSHIDSAVYLLNTALDCARHQGAVSWERRCATSLARIARSAQLAASLLLIAAD